MEVKIIDSTQDLISLKDDWNRIESGYPTITIYSTYEYVSSWWSVYQTSGQYSLWIAVVYHNNKLICIAPFCLRKVNKGRLSYKQLVFISMTDNHDVIYDAQADVNVESIYKSIFCFLDSSKKVWEEAYLSHINGKSELAYYLLKSDKNSRFKFLIENPFISFPICWNNGRIADDVLPNKTKQYANRLRRHTDYELRFEKIYSIEEIAEIHISEKNFLNERGMSTRHSLFEDSLRMELYKTLALKGYIDCYSLYDNINKKTIIYNMGFIFNDIFMSVNTGYNPEYQKFAVGKILYYEILMENGRNPLWNILDMGSGRYSWKFEWTKKFYPMYYYVEYSRNSRMIGIYRAILRIARIVRNKDE